MHKPLASMSSVAICGIATGAYEPMALAALRRFGQALPGSRLVLLRIDATAQQAFDGVSFRTLDDCVPRARWQAMRRRYSPAELCFALKPFLIDRLLEEGHEQVHYVDADCHAHAGLGLLVEDLHAADLLLTPHFATPIPDDGRTPAALTILRAGAFNAGYLGVCATPKGREFARWLSSMTERQAHNRPDAGMCGDQRWLDLAPALFPGLAICRRPGANVGYWNLHERLLARDQKGRFTVDGEPLLFFHFSGFDFAKPDRLSRHQNRHALMPGQALQALVGEYLDHLRCAGLMRLPRPDFGYRRIIGGVLGRGARDRV